MKLNVTSIKDFAKIDQNYNIFIWCTPHKQSLRYCHKEDKECRHCKQPQHDEKKLH